MSECEREVCVCVYDRKKCARESVCHRERKVREREGEK